MKGPNRNKLKTYTSVNGDRLVAQMVVVQLDIQKTISKENVIKQTFAWQLLISNRSLWLHWTVSKIILLLYLYYTYAIAS